MSLVSTKTPIFDDIASIQFFNGRLLSGEDMSTEQAWNAARRKLLGQAIGSGVAFGLEVSVSAKPEHAGKPIVTVTPGLALNADGETLSLVQETDVSLVHIEENAAPPAEFSACQPTQYSAYVQSDGVYLLAICQAAGAQGRAPVMGLANEEARCNRKYRREGVQFRLHQLKLTAAELTDRNKLRNLVAYKCFNPAAWQAFIADPFGAQESNPKLLDGQLVPKLEDCEVPLATIFWTTNAGIEYVDLWSVRRHLLTRHLAQGAPGLGSAVGLVNARAEAMLLQFQEQLAQLLQQTTQSPASMAFADHFRYLPSCGLVPIRGPGSHTGFDRATFFGSLVAGAPTTTSADKVTVLLHESWLYGPVDVTEVCMLQLYAVEENRAAVSAAQANQLYVVFASRTLHGILESDAICKAFADARTVYRGLIRRRVFLPNEVTSDAIGARITILTAIQDVMATAQFEAGLAAGRSLGCRDALNAFQDLYLAQRELALLFRTAIPGIIDPQGRTGFAETLLAYLDTAIRGGISSLKAALADRNLQAVVRAQNAINNFVGSWTGDGVANGYIKVRYKSSPGLQGDKLKPNDPDPVPQVFTVSNFTDKTLTAQLTASIEAPHGDWTDSIGIENDSGEEIESVTLASRASQDVTVNVVTGTGAQLDDTVTLTLAANVPAPHNKQHDHFKVLTVSDEEGGPIMHSVQFTQADPPAGFDLDDLAPSPSAPNVTLLIFRFKLRFAADSDPFAANFNFKATVVADPATTVGEWFVDFAGAPRNPDPNQPGVYTTPVALDSSAAADTEVTVRIRPPFTRGTTDKRATLTIQVDSTEVPDVSPAVAGPFNMRIRHA